MKKKLGQKHRCGNLLKHHIQSTPDGEGRRGDESEPNPGTNSISKGTNFVPLRKKKIPFVKNDESSTPKYPETKNSCIAKRKT